MYQKTKWEMGLERRLSDPATARGMMLAGFLNQDTPASCKIQHILELLQDTVRAAASAPNSLPRWGRIEGIDEPSAIRIRRDSDWPGFESMFRANEELKQYRPPLRLETQTRGNPLLRSRPLYDTGETEAAYALVMLAERGWATLSLLRKCPGCEKWFFAERKDQISCSAGCRHRIYAKGHYYKKRASLQSKIRYWTNRSNNAVSKDAKAKAKEKLQAAELELKDLNKISKGERT